MKREGRIFWAWTSIVLVSMAVAGVCLPKACAYVFLAQFVAGMVIGVLSLLSAPGDAMTVEAAMRNEEAPDAQNSPRDDAGARSE